jgi:hypothetical protein
MEIFCLLSCHAERVPTAEGAPSGKISSTARQTCLAREEHLPGGAPFWFDGIAMFLVVSPESPGSPTLFGSASTETALSWQRRASRAN